MNKSNIQTHELPPRGNNNGKFTLKYQSNNDFFFLNENFENKTSNNYFKLITQLISFIEFFLIKKKIKCL